MRLSHLLISAVILYPLQQIVSTWFLLDFIVARDSVTSHTLQDVEHGDQQAYSHLSALSSQIRAKHGKGNWLDNPSFDKLIFIVIDALGQEFIPSLRNRYEPNAKSSMPFLERKLKDGSAIGFVARAATPTVTMPRIKALVSGTIPSFLDLLFNLAPGYVDHPAFDNDNLISLAKSQNKSIVFYGDDTWLSLFDRRIFKRVKETFSLFASDYTTVDTNVTDEALPETELTELDWDVMILHYLGLDHIGHTHGTNEHRLIQEKLIEMDQVVGKIYHNMSKKDKLRTLIVVTGDHGMNQLGNHGGDTDLEANTANIFLPIDAKFQKCLEHPVGSEFKQIDIAVTISLLIGLPIPRSSKGVPINPILECIWSNSSHLLACAHMDNAISMIRLAGPAKFTHSYNSLVSTLESHLIHGDDQGINHRSYLSISKNLQEQLLTVIAHKSNPITILVPIVFIAGLTLIRLNVCIRELSRRSQLSLVHGLMSIAPLVIPMLMQGSTDFIEAEHKLWPIYAIMIFFIPTTMALFRQYVYHNISLKKLLEMIALIMIVSVLSSYPIMSGIGAFSKTTQASLSVLVGLPLALATMYLVIRPQSRPSSFSMCFLICTINIYELIWSGGTSLEISLKVTLERLAIMAWLFTSYDQGIVWSFLMFSCLLLRPSNVIYLGSTVLAENLLSHTLKNLCISPIQQVVVYFTFAQAAFYNQGNTNLFSSLDIKPAFFATHGFWLVSSIPVTAISTFSIQTFLYIKMFQRLRQTMKIAILKDLIINRNFLSLVYYMFVCITLRNHLFIWSVVMPKLIYHFTSNLYQFLACMLISICVRDIDNVYIIGEPQHQD